MIVRSIQGDDNINAALNGAMSAVISALVTAGKLTQADADEFLGNHVCMMMPAGGFKAFLAKLGIGDDKDIFACVRVESVRT